MTDPAIVAEPIVDPGPGAVAASSGRTGRDSLWVAGGTALSRLTGFARVFVLAYAVGQSELADLYNLANSAPNLVYELVVGGVLSATLVPLFVKARDTKDEESASVLLSVGFVAAVVLSFVALGLAAVGGTIAEHRLAGHPVGLLRARVVVDLLYLTLPQILFYAVTTLATAYLNAARQYRTAAFAPVLTNIVNIAAFAVVGLRLRDQQQILDVARRDTNTILWLGLGTTAGIVAMAVPLMVAVRRSEVAIRFAPRFRHPVVGRIARLSGWTFGYVVANQLALTVVLLLLPDNKRYSDAFIFFQLPHGLIAVSIMTTMTPELASAAAGHDYQALADRFGRGLRLLAALVIPAAVGYVLLATPITSFLKHGNLTAEDARLTARAVTAFAVGLPAFSAYLFAMRGFYALSDTKTPFFLNAIENGVNVVLVVLLADVGQRSSTTFALAYSIAYVVAAALALRRLDRRLHELDPNLRRPDLAPILRMVAAALAMGVVVWLVRLVLPDDEGIGALAAVVLGVVLGAVSYIGAGLALGIPEVRSVWAGIGRRLHR